MQIAELREAVREAALDELFRHRQPILCVIDPRTLLAAIPQAAENRNGETWQTVLKQYPNLEFVVSDQASGLRKGVNACGREIAHQYDVFHFKREIGRWLRGQEARCYELMEQVEQARRLIDAPRLLSSARMQARVEYREKAAALDERLLAFDWVELIVSYLYEGLTAYDARRREIRTRAGAEATVDEVIDLLKEVNEINAKPLISMIEGARPGLLTFLTALEEKLQRIEVRWLYVTGCRRAAFNAMARAWHHRAHANQSRRRQRSYLAALCDLGHWSRRVENFSEVERQICEALDQVVRASSAVECFNSSLRPYVSVKKQCAASSADRSATKVVMNIGTSCTHRA